MKTKIALIASLLTIGLGTGFATTTDEVEISSGALTATITDYTGAAGTGTCTGSGCVDLNMIGGIYDTNGSAGAMAVATKAAGLNGWSISGIIGNSNSPGLVPYGLDISSLTASCSLSSCGALDITYSDINFNVPVAAGGFVTSFSGTDTGNGSVTETAYFSNSNALFATTTTIGSVTLAGSVKSGSASGGPIAAVPNYSLTLAQVFTGSSGAAFSVDGNITAVPEPGAVVLFGTLLVLCATKLRRRVIS
jgi:hypothetical protein